MFNSCRKCIRVFVLKKFQPEAAKNLARASVSIKPATVYRQTDPPELCRRNNLSMLDKSSRESRIVIDSLIYTTIIVDYWNSAENKRLVRLKIRLKIKERCGEKIDV